MIQSDASCPRAWAGGDRSGNNPTPWLRAGSLVALIMVCAACDRQSTGTIAVATDSAGIWLVENAIATTMDDWAIEPMPFLVIGGDETDAAQQLFDVTDALRLADGRVIVANGGNSEIRIYSPSGRLDHAMGRQGEGPGEFRFLIHVTLNDDGDVVGWDSGGRARNEFSVEGEFLRRIETAPSALPSMRETTLVLPNGSVIIKALDPASVRSMPTAPVRSRVWVVLVKNGTTSADTLGEWPDESVYYPETGGRRMALHTLFTPQTLVAAGGPAGVILVGETARPQFAVFDSAGRRLRIVRWTPMSRTATDEDISLKKEEWLATRGARLSTAAANQLLAEMTVSEPVPEYAQIVVDSEGFVWVGQYALPTDSRMNWLIFDPDGDVVANAETTPQFNPLEIGCDYVIAHATDEVGVERLELYKLTRTTSCQSPDQSR